MKNIMTLVIAVAVLVQGCAVATDEPVATKPATACGEFGEAPEVTTIRTPATATAPHSDCVELEERSSLGQKVFCCMGDDFNEWYKGLKF